MRSVLLAGAAALGLVVLLGLAALRALLPSGAPPRPDAGHRYFESRTASREAPWVVAHRGGMGQWPENTLYAFRRALAAGADVLDMDVRSSADGRLVVFHDAHLDRTTDGSGPVSERSLAELRGLDAGYGWSRDGGETHPYRGRGLRVPTVAEVFAELPGVRLGLEIKPPAEGLAEPLCRSIRSAGMQDRVLVASFESGATHRFREACPEVATGATFAEALRFTILQRLGLDSPAGLPADSLLVPTRFGPLEPATPGFVRAARRLRLPVQVWVANELSEMRSLLAAGVDGIITDYPERLVDLLSAGPRGR